MQRIVIATALVLAPTALGFENAKTLPKGVRNIDLRSVNTDIEEKSNGQGKRQSLATPLMQDLTFGKIAQGESELKANQLRAFLTTNGFSEDDVVGSFTADLNGHLSVFAPITSYGVTDNFTIAIAVPYYKAETSVEVGFQPNATAQAFLDSLASTENNQTAAAREAGNKLNKAVERLNQKLVDNGYASLDDWEGQGLGDITIAGKNRIFRARRLEIAATSGVVLPTGRTDDPEILNDLAFGDGQADVFEQFTFDQPLNFDFRLTEFGRYTVQMPGNKNVREVEEDEKIEVDEATTHFKLGDKIDAGTSLVWEPKFGLVTGVGYTFFKKYGDTYKDLNSETKSLLEAGTDQQAQNIETMLGYSTIPAYQRGDFAAPIELKLTYIKQFRSKNMPVTDLAQFDFNLYF